MADQRSKPFPGWALAFSVFPWRHHGIGNLFSNGRLILTALAWGLGMGNLTPEKWLMSQETKGADREARLFLDSVVNRLRPLEIASARAWWDANTTGKDEAFAAKQQAEDAVNLVLADRQQFQQLQALRQQKISDPLLARQLQLLHLQLVSKQVAPELLQRISSVANEIEKKFNVYRAHVGDRTLTDSEVRKVLTDSRDSTERQRVWEASKGVGQDVIDDLRRLVDLRNQSARELGFSDFHVMQLQVNEQNQADVLRLFDELDELTRKPFAQAKAEMDRRLAQRYNVPIGELQAWHYHDPFFQEPPSVYDVDLDLPFAQSNLLGICESFYDDIGLPIRDVIARSDLYEKPGKSPHAFCTDIDREGDVRVLANVVPNQYWMETMLHELGHSVYTSKNIPAEVPYLLRDAAHILTTEGVAMMFERFATSSTWLKNYGVTIENPREYEAAGRRSRQDKLLVFSRWCQVMLRFEKEMYRDPSQDLNSLWWELVERYQLIPRPAGRHAPDFASKIHIVSAPAYYHNYMMGELFACQLHAAITRDVLKSSDPKNAIYMKEPGVGRFMIEKVIAPGRTLDWNGLTRFATGEPLNAKAFALELQAD